MEWYRVDVGFPRSPKLGTLARALGIKRDAATLAVLRLFDWAASACEDGVLTGVHADDVAEAMGVRGDGARVVDALVSSGLVDSAEGRLEIHGWVERQGPLLAGRERTRRFRERARARREAVGDVDREFDEAEDGARNVRGERRGRGARNARGNVSVTLQDTLQDTLPTRYGNGPLPTDLPKNQDNGIPPALCAGGLPNAAGAARDAARAPEPPRPGWVALAALPEAELMRVIVDASKGAERGDEAQRRLFYAAQRERQRRRDAAVSMSDAAKLTETVNVGPCKESANAQRPDAGTGRTDVP